MADATYDMVIVGGGNTALVLGMYLTKYGGMKTLILEERNELGGGWESIENAAPGYTTSSHSYFHGTVWYRLPTEEDFPEFIEYGAKNIAHDGMSVGIIFNEDDTATGLFNGIQDPSGERSAELLGRYSKRDAETWLKYCEAMPMIEKYAAEAFCTVPNPADPMKGPEGVFMRMLQDPIVSKVLDPHYIQMTPKSAMQTFFEAPENQQMPLRWMYSAGIPTMASGQGADCSCFRTWIGPGVWFC